MVRFLYARLLTMHPVAFRESFGAEMLWIFDESAHWQGRWAMLVDCLASLFRQWLLRSGLWRILLACAIASLQFLAASFLWHLPKIVPCFPRATDSLAHGKNGAGLPAIALGAACTLVAAAAFWARNRTASKRDPMV